MGTLEILSEMLTDQCMKLTATLLSKYDFIDLSHPVHDYWCPFEQFTNRHDEIFTKELIELSALARVNLDIDSTFGSKEIVGILFESKKKSDLTFRQACNKIIHAKTYEVKLNWSPGHPLDNGRNGYGDSKINKFKNPIIKTEGEYYSKQWQAEINFLKYIETINECFPA